MMFRLVFAFAALAASVYATGYIDGREYVYKYHGEIYTGFPRIKSQYSGYSFHAKVILQPHGDYAVVKVADLENSQFNGEFENVHKHPFEYKALPQAAFFTRPFKIFRKNGIVTHFDVEKDEPALSVNFKRSMAALFNLNFEAPETGPSTDDNDILKTDPDAHYYKVYEEGVLGECETAYGIEHHPHYRNPHNNIVLNVTKTRNYHKCNSAPNQVYSTFYGHECAAAEHEKAHTLHGSASYHYDIRGYRHNYVIERIVVNGEIAFTPYPTEGQTVATYTNRYLTLIEEHDTATPLEVSNDLESHDSLVYDFTFQKNFKDPVDLKQPHFMYHMTGRKVPVDAIKGQVEELVQVYHDDTYQEKFKDKNFPAKFVELLRSVGSIGYDEIEELYNLYADIPLTGATEEQRRYRSLFIDVLVNSGTNPAVLFGKYLIENKKARPQEISYFFGQLPFHIKEVSETLLDGFQELCESSNVKKHPSLYAPCLLSFSSVIYDHCVARYHPEGIPPSREHKTCQPQDAIKYFDFIAKLFEETSNVKLKTLYLKAAGNIGLREIIPHVKSYIEGAQFISNQFRYNAMWSLKHVGNRFPDKIKELLVPVLFNQTERHEVRLYAFELIMMSRPEVYGMEGFARALKHDPDDQLRSYAYSTFKDLANSTHPCTRQSSKDALYALRILEDVHHEFEKYDYTYSHKRFVSGYDPHYNYGGSSTFAYFASDTGYIPQSAYLGIDDFIGGKYLPTIGLGMRQQGLEKFLDTIIGPEGSLGKRSFFDLFKKRAKRDTDAVEKELNEIKSKVDIPVVDYEPIDGEVFFNFMGNQLSYFPFDEKTFETFFKEGRFTIPNLPALWQNIAEFYYQRFMLTIDKFYVIPSESGIPIIFDYKQPVYFYHHNKASSFKVEPGFFAEERGGKFPDHVKFETDGHIAVDKNLFASMSLFMPIDQVNFGSGINRRATLSLPLKLKFDLDVKEKKLSYKWTPVAPHEIYHYKYEPYTFIDSYTNSVPKSLEPGYLPVTRLSKKELHRSFLHDALGYGFDVNAHYENEFNDKGSWIRFLYEKDYREKFYYLFSNPHFEPYDIDIEFTKATEAATHESEGYIKYTYHDSEYARPEFATEGFEDFKSPADRGHTCTCSLDFELHRTGDKDRKVNVAFDWTRDLERTYHKLNFYYDRSPFWKSETQHLKICGSSYVKYPKYDIAKVVTFDTLGMDHTVKSEAKIHFGKDCTSDQKIKVEGRFYTTDEQREFESHRDEPDTPEHYNPYAHYYQECIKARQQTGAVFGEDCMHYIEQISTVHGYDFHVKHEKLSSRFLYYAYKARGWLKHAFHEYAEHIYDDVDPTQQYSAPGEFHVYSNYSLRLPVADVKVVKPHVISKYTHVYDPHYTGFRSYPEFEDIHVKNSFSEVHCKLEGDHVVTFDHYEYNLPPIDCYKIITKDCSPKELFTVLGTKITHPKYKKALKVFLGKHKIEALPLSDDSDIVIRVDGKRVPVTKTEPYFHHDSDHHHDHHQPLFYITFRDVYYALHSEKYGLIVEYTGEGIRVQASPYYRNKLCGLCGNYNGQKYDGYTDKNGCYFENDDAHAYAYSIPSDTCSVPKFEKKCPTEGGFGCTKLRTKVIELATGKAPQTCFSTEPVAECSSHCKARSTINRKVSFHCLPSKDDSTKDLVRQQASRVIHEVRRKSKDHEAEVEVPDVCLHE